MSSAVSDRLRSEAIDHLLAAAQAAGVGRIVSHSHAGFNGVQEGRRVETEDDPLALTAGTETMAQVEQLVIEAGGLALRYGALYGRGANDGQVALVRKRMLPIVAGGATCTSWVHVDDAASATVLAVELTAQVS